MLRRRCCSRQASSSYHNWNALVSADWLHTRFGAWQPCAKYTHPNVLRAMQYKLGWSESIVLAFVLDYRCNSSKVVASAEICVVRYRLGRVR